MAKVKVREGESFDSALRRFKRMVEKDQIIAEVKKREYYVKPAVKRKLKSQAARARRYKNL